MAPTTQQELIEKLSEALQKIPGVAYTITQPMEMRMDETVTGIRGDVAIKIFGDDLKTLEDLGKRTLAIVSSNPGSRRAANGSDLRGGRAAG